MSTELDAATSISVIGKIMIDRRRFVAVKIKSIQGIEGMSSIGLPWSGKRYKIRLLMIQALKVAGSFVNPCLSLLEKLCVKAQRAQFHPDSIVGI